MECDIALAHWGAQAGRIPRSCNRLLQVSVRSCDCGSGRRPGGLGNMDRGYGWGLSQGDPLDLPRERTTDPLSTVLGSLVGTFSVVSITWMVILGFVGGTVPVAGWHLPGRPAGGLAWLMVVAGLGIAVLWVGPLLLAMAVYAGLSRLAPALARAVKRPPRRHRPSNPISRAA